MQVILTRRTRNRKRERKNSNNPLLLSGQFKKKSHNFAAFMGAIGSSDRAIPLGQTNQKTQNLR
jgi:hypothetical protein